MDVEESDASSDEVVEMIIISDDEPLPDVIFMKEVAPPIKPISLSFNLF